MKDAYVGQIVLLPFRETHIPPGWALCDGRTLNIADYENLFAEIGYKFGGRGGETFVLPRLEPPAGSPGVFYYIRLQGDLYPKDFLSPFGVNEDHG